MYSTSRTSYIHTYISLTGKIKEDKRENAGEWPPTTVTLLRRGANKQTGGTPGPHIVPFRPASGPSSPNLVNQSDCDLPRSLLARHSPATSSGMRFITYWWRIEPCHLPLPFGLAFTCHTRRLSNFRTYLVLSWPPSCLDFPHGCNGSAFGLDGYCEVSNTIGDHRFNLTMCGGSLCYRWISSLTQDEIPFKLRCAICNKLAVNAFRLPCCDQAICENCTSSIFLRYSLYSHHDLI